MRARQHHLMVKLVSLLLLLTLPCLLDGLCNSWFRSRSAAPKSSSTLWAKAPSKMKPGYGGWWPGDPTAPKFKVTVKSNSGEDIHILDVPRDRFIYSYFEENGIDLPIKNAAKMCRQGCCTTCAAKVESGRVVMDNPLGLLKEMREEGYVLTCSSCPRSDVVLQLQDEDEVYKKQWGESFEGGVVEWGGFLPEDD